MLSNAQYRLLERFDELIEENEHNDKFNLRKYIRQDGSLRVRCCRVFGSVNNALDAYGFEEVVLEEIPDPQIPHYFIGAFKIDDFGNIVILRDVYDSVENFLNEYGYYSDETKVKRIIRDSLIEDSIDFYYRMHGVEGIKRLSEKYHDKNVSTVKYLIRVNFGGVGNYARSCGVDYRLYSEHTSNFRELVELGLEFEELVSDIFDEMEVDYTSQKRIDDSIPDFVVGGNWIDAKLSRSTALNPQCKTIEKYRKHTDYLTIIYALDDTEEIDDRADFVHVTEYFPYISDGLKRKIDAFIRKATEVRFGGESRSK